MAFANKVFPVPGGPCRRTPLGASTPNLLNNSGCLNGSSIISLTLPTASPSPPISSYVIDGTPPSFDTFTAFALSSETVILVESFTITGPEGLVEITTRSTRCPMTLSGIVSPFVINCPFRYSARYSSAPTILSGSVGANVILLASFDSTLLTSIWSLIPTSSLFLVYPSIRIRPLPLSLLLAGQLRTVVFLPSEDNSNASPLVILSRSITSGSTRAIFLPTSRCSASATFRATPLADSFLPLCGALLSLLLLLSIFEDILYSYQFSAAFH